MCGTAINVWCDDDNTVLYSNIENDCDALFQACRVPNIPNAITSPPHNTRISVGESFEINCNQHYNVDVTSQLSVTMYCIRGGKFSETRLGSKTMIPNCTGGFFFSFFFF